MPKDKPLSREEREFREGFQKDCAAIVSPEAMSALADFKAKCAASGKK